MRSAKVPLEIGRASKEPHQLDLIDITRSKVPKRPIKNAKIKPAID
jgi:hypothetical protein